MIKKVQNKTWHLRDDIPKGEWAIALDGVIDIMYPLNINLQLLYDNFHQFVEKIEFDDEVIEKKLQEWIYKNCDGAELKIIFGEFHKANTLTEKAKKK